MITVHDIVEWRVCTYVSLLGAYMCVHMCYICVTVVVLSEWSKQMQCALMCVSVLDVCM